MMEKITLVSEDLIRRGITPVLLCAPILRIYLKRLIDRFMSDLVVLSYNEIEQNIEVEVVGMVAV